MRVKLKGINTVRYPAADGSTVTYYYHRATGRRLQGEPGTAEFQASFEEAGRASSQERGAGTVSWLIRQYCDSLQWKKLAESTRAIGTLNLKAAEAKWGTTPLKHVENPRSRPLFLRWHDSLAETQPRAADNKLAALARVFSWGYDRGHVTHNPIATFERAYGNSRAELIWLPEHVTAFEAAAGPEIELALLLALHTGQRQGDLLRLPWSAYDGHAITMRQGKGGRKVWIPATIALRDALGTAPRRATTMLTKADGVAWSKSAFHHAWKATFAKAGISDDLHFHDLRGTAVTMLSEAGCTPQEIATITGHTLASVNKILEVYLARTKALAQSAIVKLDAHCRNAR
ncbi:tyrosine-type recombinase/integrase [Methylobacterium sp. E-025]|uniref:tyrosine-type recombinase/integrase n=1 Tax=Methylobacterium sp. E-025 TaxID=2836561 RepID=UPI001FB94E69|nr:tyrosine-type recombinase/integrase [Methylobacterium sp. E-025]MCJ2112928.1 tyrosine-type recombinase/integrase [Methylobacterium sp. E-025]